MQEKHFKIAVISFAVVLACILWLLNDVWLELKTTPRVVMTLKEGA